MAEVTVGSVSVNSDRG